MIARLYYVRCDQCGRPCGTGRDLADTSAEARRRAKRMGWLRVPKRSHAAGGSPGGDYCPACTTKDGVA